MQEDSLSPSGDPPGERREQPLLQLELTQPCCTGLGWAEPASGEGPDVNTFPRGFNPQPAPLCLLECEQEPGLGVAEESNGGDISIFAQGYSSHPERNGVAGDLIAFTPWMPSQDTTSSAMQVHSEKGSPVLEPAADNITTEAADVIPTASSSQLGNVVTDKSGGASEEASSDAQGGADSLLNTDSEPAAESSESGYVAASRSDGSVSGGSREGSGSVTVNRSRLPTSRKQLRNCSIFDSSVSPTIIPTRCCTFSLSSGL